MHPKYSLLSQKTSALVPGNAGGTSGGPSGYVFDIFCAKTGFGARVSLLEKTNRSKSKKAISKRGEKILAPFQIFLLPFLNY